MPSLTCVDLFAGCGGLSLGFENAGFRPLLFSEINPSAADTYLHNRPSMDIIRVGNIYKLSNAELKKYRKIWGTVDVVCGGPPCQGYSGIGHRRTFNELQKEEIPSNHLFQEMSRVIKVLRPKAFLFENVSGLLSSRWTSGGERGEIFRDVFTELHSIEGYSVRWQLIYAKNYGVPQNRPRVLVVGVQEQYCDSSLDDFETGLDSPWGFATGIQDGFLPSGGQRPPDLVEALGDLLDKDYLKKEATIRYPHPAKGKFAREMRRDRKNGKVSSKGTYVTEHEYSKHSTRVRKKFTHMIKNDGEIPPEFQTKKFSQKVLPRKWGAGGPNITATSLPDDYVHYEQPRILTVREWARLQSFPDWYEFKGPRTTGGRRRAGDPSINEWDREVPRYTQIGNAVPVLLAQAVATHLRDILEGKVRPTPRISKVKKQERFSFAGQS